MDNVKTIRQGIVMSEDKQAFLDYVASEYDALAAHSNEPVVIVFAFANIDGIASASYLTKTAIADRNMLYIARAVQAIQTGMVTKWDKNGD